MRCVFITGGSRGFGRGTALEFAAQGIPVAILARTESDLQEVAAEVSKRGAEALVLPGDMTDAEVVRKAMKQAAEHFGGIDVLVNVGGTYAKQLPFERLTWDDWLTNINVDVHGMFNALQAALPIMRQQKKGVIVNVSSTAAISDAPFLTSYGAAKAAQLSLSNSLKSEVKPVGIVVHCLCPVLTPHGNIGQEGIRRFADLFGISEQQVIAQLVPPPQLTAEGVGRAILELTEKAEGAVWKVDGFGLHPTSFAF